LTPGPQVLGWVGDHFQIPTVGVAVDPTHISPDDPAVQAVVRAPAGTAGDPRRSRHDSAPPADVPERSDRCRGARPLRAVHRRISPPTIRSTWRSAKPGSPPRYADARPGASGLELSAAVLTDRIFREPAYAFARERAGTYLYEFAWRSPLPGVGAAHGLDVGFVFDNLGHCTLEGDAPPPGLAGALHRAWVTFVRFGRPGWSAYPQLMVFDVKPRTETAG
jgi:hypothetical protein